MKMLYAEGKSNGEQRYYKIMATLLLSILDSLSLVRSVLFFLAGALVAHIIFGS